MSDAMLALASVRGYILNIELVEPFTVGPVAPLNLQHGANGL